MGLTRTAALDYAKHGIQINAVNPGFTGTEMIERTLNQLSRTVDDLAKADRSLTLYS